MEMFYTQAVIEEKQGREEEGRKGEIGQENRGSLLTCCRADGCPWLERYVLNAYVITKLSVMFRHIDSLFSISLLSDLIRSF